MFKRGQSQAHEESCTERTVECELCHIRLKRTVRAVRQPVSHPLWLKDGRVVTVGPASVCLSVQELLEHLSDASLLGSHLLGVAGMRRQLQQAREANDSLKHQLEELKAGEDDEGGGGGRGRKRPRVAPARRSSPPARSRALPWEPPARTSGLPPSSFASALSQRRRAAGENDTRDIYRSSLSNYLRDGPPQQQAPRFSAAAGGGGGGSSSRDRNDRPFRYVRLFPSKPRLLLCDGQAVDSSLSRPTCASTCVSVLPVLVVCCGGRCRTC